MKKIIIKYLVRYLFKKDLLNIVDIFVYLRQLEIIWKTKENSINQFCLDVARLRKWLCNNIIIYLDKDKYDVMNSDTYYDITSHICKNRYTNTYKEFAENFKEHNANVDDILKIKL